MQLVNKKYPKFGNRPVKMSQYERTVQEIYLKVDRIDELQSIRDELDYLVRKGVINYEL